MKQIEILPDPKWKLKELLKDSLLNKQTFFIGCVSYEDRCKTAIRYVLGVTNKSIPVNFIEIKDDECTHLPWKKKCAKKTRENWKKLEKLLSKVHIELINQPMKYKMSTRSEDVLRLKDDLTSFKESQFPNGGKLRCIFDVSSMPSYFALQLLKTFIEDNMISDLIILYTKPKDYPPGVLKYSPLDKTNPDFLPYFGRRKRKVKWIVGVGFDYDSIKNAERIKAILEVEKIYVVVPFPAYKPEYAIRAMAENANLIQEKEDYWYTPADSPFRAFRLLCELVGEKEDFILSTFGPKPICLGFGLAAIKMNIPILHVQATNYNPDFSIGEGDTLAYWVKYQGKMWEPPNNK